MITLGLTGGIGMGKSTCAQLLQRRPVPVVDTDDLARKVVEPGQPALQEIRLTFGEQVLFTDGHLNRKALAQLVFADPAARQNLEAILHPRIRELWRSQMAAWSREGHPLAVVVIPLLFETQAEKELEFTACLACSANTQRQRLLARGWSEQQIIQRLEAQFPVERKIAKADFLIWTEGSLEVHSSQLDLMLRSI